MTDLDTFYQTACLEIEKRKKEKVCIQAGICPACGGPLVDDSRGSENLSWSKCTKCHSIYLD